MSGTRNGLLIGNSGIAAWAFLAVTLIASPAIAADQAPAAPASGGKGDCTTARTAQTAPTGEPATPPAQGPHSGTKNAGSTGWSGSGLGGAHTTTVPGGASPASKTEHPATVQGLDPGKGGVASAAPC